MIEVNADTSSGMGAIGRMQVVVRCERVFISICARRNGRAFASLTARGGGLPIGVTIARQEEPRHFVVSCERLNITQVRGVWLEQFRGESVAACLLWITSLISDTL